MNWQQRKALNEERSKTLADMQTMLDAANTEKRDLKPEEDTQFTAMNTRAEELGTQIERYDKLIALHAEGNNGTQNRSQQQPGREDIDTGKEERDEKAELETRAFDRFLRHGWTGSEEERALTKTGQGIVGIRPFAVQTFDSMKTYAGVIQAGAEIITTGHGNDFTFGTGNDTANEGRLVAEAATNSNQTLPTLGNATLKAHKFSSDWITVSHEMLQDADYDVQAYIVKKAAERIGRAFNKYATIGTGTAQPQGVTVGGSSGVVAASTTAITYEELLDLIHSVDAAYRSQPGFGLMLADTTLSAVRKLKDGDGRYIFAAGTAGVPGEILGYRYTVNNHMAELDGGVSSKVVVAGDFGRVVVRNVTPPTIIQAFEKFADDGLVGFKVDSRHDARVADSSAVKWLALAAA